MLTTPPYILVRFVDAPDFVTAAIDFQTNSLWPHVEFGTPEGTWIGAHASGGIQERKEDYCKPKRERVYAIPVSPNQAEALLASARAAIGTPYNFGDIFGLLLHNRHIDDKHRLICSQFVIKELEKVGIYLLNVADGYEYLVTPEMVHLSPLLRGRLIHQIPEVFG